jgi:hypothetical protein
MINIGNYGWCDYMKIIDRHMFNIVQEFNTCDQTGLCVVKLGELGG